MRETNAIRSKDRIVSSVALTKYNCEPAGVIVPPGFWPPVGEGDAGGVNVDEG